MYSSLDVAFDKVDLCPMPHVAGVAIKRSAKEGDWGGEGVARSGLWLCSASVGMQERGRSGIQCDTVTKNRFYKRKFWDFTCTYLWNLNNRRSFKEGRRKKRSEPSRVSIHQPSNYSFLLFTPFKIFLN